MQLGPSWNVSSYRATQRIPGILMNHLLHVQKKLPLDRIMSQMNPIRTHPISVDTF
jgi:hypothetical protein